MTKITFVLLYLAMTSINHWPLHQLDIKNAFMHGELQEEVYMDQTSSFTASGGSHLVYRL